MARHNIWLTRRTETLLAAHQKRIRDDTGGNLALSPLVCEALEEHFVAWSLAQRGEGAVRTGLDAVETAITHMQTLRSAILRQIAARERNLPSQTNLLNID